MEKWIAQIGDIIQFPTARDRQVMAQNLNPTHSRKRFKPIAYLLAVLRNGQPDWLMVGLKIEDTKKELPPRWPYRIDFDLLSTFGSLLSFVTEFEGRTIKVTRLIDGLPYKSYIAIGGNYEELQRLKELIK